MAGYLSYPLPGFHFLVVFEVFPLEVGFQEVSGLSFDIGYETIESGGINNYSLRLPTGATYSDLTLKRGFGLVSGISAWIIDAVENFNYKPTNLLISLLDEEHLPVSSWYVVNALPVRWEISPFNAEDGSIVIETLTLRYDYFKTLNLSAALAPVVDAVSSLIAPALASVKISVP